MEILQETRDLLGCESKSIYAGITSENDIGGGLEVRHYLCQFCHYL